MFILLLNSCVGSMAPKYGDEYSDISEYVVVRGMSKREAVNKLRSLFCDLYYVIQKEEIDRGKILDICAKVLMLKCAIPNILERNSEVNREFEEAMTYLNNLVYILDCATSESASEIIDIEFNEGLRDSLLTELLVPSLSKKSFKSYITIERVYEQIFSEDVDIESKKRSLNSFKNSMKLYEKELNKLSIDKRYAESFYMGKVAIKLMEKRLDVDIEFFSLVNSYDSLKDKLDKSRDQCVKKIEIDSKVLSTNKKIRRNSSKKGKRQHDNLTSSTDTADDENSYLELLELYISDIDNSSPKEKVLDAIKKLRALLFMNNIISEKFRNKYKKHYKKLKNIAIKKEYLEDFEDAKMEAIQNLDIITAGVLADLGDLLIEK